MSVVLQFCDLRKQLSPNREHDRTPPPAGTAEIVIFPGIRIERRAPWGDAAPGVGAGAAGETAAGSRSAGGADDGPRS